MFGLNNALHAPFDAGRGHMHPCVMKTLIHCIWLCELKAVTDQGKENMWKIAKMTMTNLKSLEQHTYIYGSTLYCKHLSTHACIFIKRLHEVYFYKV